MQLPKWSHEGAMLACSIAAALAAIAAAVATFETVRAQRDASQEQLRAYVLLDAKWLEAQERDQNRYRVLVRFKNYGQTPALKTRAVGWVDMLPWPMEAYAAFPRPPVPSYPGAQGVALPQGDTGIWYAQSYSDLPQRVADLNSGRRRIFVYGEVQYEDIFHRKQKTTYCLFYEGDVLTACPSGNTVQ